MLHNLYTCGWCVVDCSQFCLSSRSGLFCITDFEKMTVYQTSLVTPRVHNKEYSVLMVTAIMQTDLHNVHRECYNIKFVNVMILMCMKATKSSEEHLNVLIIQ